MTIRSNVTVEIAGLSLLTVAVDSTVPTSSDESPGGLNVVCNGHHDARGRFKAHPVARVQQIYRCPQCATEGGRDVFPRGRIMGDTATILSPEELKQLEADETTRTTMRVYVHDSLDTQDLMPTGKVYYLVPPSNQSTSYALLMEVLDNRPDLVLCTVWSARSKAALYTLGIKNKALVINQMAWPTDVKEAPRNFASPQKEQVKLLTELLDNSLAGFSMELYTNEAKAHAEEIIAAKAAVEAVPQAKKKNPAPATVLDLTLDLQRAIETKVKTAKPAKATVNRRSKVKVNG